MAYRIFFSFQCFPFSVSSAGLLQIKRFAKMTMSRLFIDCKRVTNVWHITFLPCTYTSRKLLKLFWSGCLLILMSDSHPNGK